MGRRKITIAGAGNVGATTAHIAVGVELGDIVLIDIIDGLAEGKALDLSQAGPIQKFNCKITGSTDWQETAGSDIIIITSGMPRKLGMSRDDLLAKNTEIVKSVTAQAAKYSPDSFIIVVANPLDAMVYVAAKTSGFAGNKVMGMAGALDCARFTYFITDQLGASAEDVECVLMGGHGDDMVPLPRFTTVSQVALTELMAKDKIDALIERTRKGGIEIVNLLGYSAYYAPAAGAVKMAEAILKDKKITMSCCAFCKDEYGVGGYFVGVPVVLGSGGVEKIVELELNKEESEAFEQSVLHVKELVSKVEKLI